MCEKNFSFLLGGVYSEELNSYYLINISWSRSSDNSFYESTKLNFEELPNKAIQTLVDPPDTLV